MLQVNVFEDNVEEYEVWFEQHLPVFRSELTALQLQLLKVGKNISGIQVGVGTGRFAAALGIREGVEPAAAMRAIATKRGIEVMNAVAERLPYKDLHFDFVLLVTIEHLDDIKLALREAHRVLKPGGALILGFIDQNSKIGKAYEDKRIRSRFYRHATFYPVEKVIDLLKKAQFRNLDFVQTLFGDLDDIDLPQSPKAGYGEGSFVVVKAEKA